MSTCHGCCHWSDDAQLSANGTSQPGFKACPLQLQSQYRWCPYPIIKLGKMPIWFTHLAFGFSLVKATRLDCVIHCLMQYITVHSSLGSSDFPRSLCFVWFWFGLEILRLVYKKTFFKILIDFYLIWAFNFQKNSTVPYKSWKKISSKLGVQGIKRSGILRWFQKCVELLRQEVPKDFFSKFSKFLKIQFFCKIFFPFCQTLDFCTFFEG